MRWDPDTAAMPSKAGAKHGNPKCYLVHQAKAGGAAAEAWSHFSFTTAVLSEMASKNQLNV